MSYQSVWICKGCGEVGYLPHNNVVFAPDICPGCGAAPDKFYRFEQFSKGVARLEWRPRGLNVFRHVWVDRDGRELTPRRASTEARDG